MNENATMSEQQTNAPSHHDVHVTTSRMKRTSITDLPYGYELACTPTGGWVLWGPSSERAWTGQVSDGELGIASEYGPGLRIDVAGHVICDSLTKQTARHAD